MALNGNKSDHPLAIGQDSRQQLAKVSFALQPNNSDKNPSFTSVLSAPKRQDSCFAEPAKSEPSTFASRGSSKAVFGYVPTSGQRLSKQPSLKAIIEHDQSSVDGDIYQKSSYSKFCDSSISPRVELSSRQISRFTTEQLSHLSTQQLAAIYPHLSSRQLSQLSPPIVSVIQQISRKKIAPRCSSRITLELTKSQLSELSKGTELPAGNHTGGPLHSRQLSNRQASRIAHDQQIWRRSSRMNDRALPKLNSDSHSFPSTSLPLTSRNLQKARPVLSSALTKAGRTPGSNSPLTFVTPDLQHQHSSDSVNSKSEQEKEALKEELNFDSEKEETTIKEAKPLLLEILPPPPPPPLTREISTQTSNVETTERPGTAVEEEEEVIVEETDSSPALSTPSSPSTAAKEAQTVTEEILPESSPSSSTSFSYSHTPSTSMPFCHSHSDYARHSSVRTRALRNRSLPRKTHYSSHYSIPIVDDYCEEYTSQCLGARDSHPKAGSSRSPELKKSFSIELLYDEFRPEVSTIRPIDKLDYTYEHFMTMPTEIVESSGDDGQRQSPARRSTKVVRIVDTIPETKSNMRSSIRQTTTHTYSHTYSHHNQQHHYHQQHDKLDSHTNMILSEPIPQPARSYKCVKYTLNDVRSC